MKKIRLFCSCIFGSKARFNKFTCNSENCHFSNISIKDIVGPEYGVVFQKLILKKDWFSNCRKQAMVSISKAAFSYESATNSFSLLTVCVCIFFVERIVKCWRNRPQESVDSYTPQQRAKEVRYNLQTKRKCLKALRNRNYIFRETNLFYFYHFESFNKVPYILAN